ncbi:hypothetical protein [Gordonia sp. DT101]|uniref:hypothetical protein n=1 Tax=Gordonia sp. DT101 TaxID=3416545 RepID=UPI003CE880BB
MTSTLADGSRPTEAECWSEFWKTLAKIWAELSPEVQQECVEEAERERLATSQDETRR